MKRTLFSCCMWLTTLALPLLPSGILRAESGCGTTVYNPHDGDCVCPYAETESYDECQPYYNHCDPAAEVDEPVDVVASEELAPAEPIEEPTQAGDVEPYTDKQADYWYDSESGSYHYYDFTGDEAVSENTAEDTVNDYFDIAEAEAEDAASEPADVCEYADEYGDYYSDYEDYGWEYDEQSYCLEDEVPAVDPARDVTATEATDPPWQDSIVEDPWQEEYDYAYDDEEYEYRYGDGYDYDAEVTEETQWDAALDESPDDQVTEDAWEDEYYSDYGYDYEYWEEQDSDVQATEAEDNVATVEDEDEDANKLHREAVLSLARTLDRFGSALQNISQQLTDMVTEQVAEGPTAEATQR